MDVHIGSQKFSTSANDTGEYLINISVRDTLQDQIVKIVASGVEADSRMKLMSKIGSVSTLQSAAGVDQLLTEDELYAVNISSVTTSIGALMEDVNSDKQTDQTVFEKTLKTYDSDLVLPLAAAIRLVIDNSASNANLALPGGISNSLDIVRDLAVVKNISLNQMSWKVSFIRLLKIVF